MQPIHKNLLTDAIAAAEKDTIMITAIDSLNNCCLLGHTTSLSSSNVELKNSSFSSALLFQKALF